MPRRNRKAVAAFVLGLCSIVLFGTFVVPLLALIFGLIASGEIKRSVPPQSGRRMATWGWVLGLLGVIAFAAIVVVAVADRDDNPPDQEAAIGTCYNLPETDNDELTEAVGFEDVPCTESHDGELFHKGELNPDRDRSYPGEDAVFAEAAENCAADPFETYVGVEYSLSKYDVYIVIPVEVAWKNTNGLYQCYVVDPDGDPIVGSVKATGE
jgi:Domain of unknown function (DUF4190)/Septum formation